MTRATAATGTLSRRQSWAVRGLLLAYLLALCGVRPAAPDPSTATDATARATPPAKCCACGPQRCAEGACCCAPEAADAQPPAPDDNSPAPGVAVPLRLRVAALEQKCQGESALGAAVGLLPCLESTLTRLLLPPACAPLVAAATLPPQSHLEPPPGPPPRLG